jgi:hypothetical protein
MTELPERGYEEVEGHCQAIEADGTRCPNPAEPGSRYCGRPEHSSLEDVPSDHVAAPAAEIAEDLEETEGSVDEGAQEAAAGEQAAAIGGAPEVEPPVEGEVAAADRAVVEGGGGSARPEQEDDDLRRAAEEVPEADLTPDGQGFDEPTRRP